MKHTTEVMITAEEIDQKLDILAEQINAHYADSDRAITDALRLSRGMSYKNAMAGLPMGGGKIGRASCRERV